MVRPNSSLAVIPIRGGLISPPPLYFLAISPPIAYFNIVFFFFFFFFSSHGPTERSNKTALLGAHLPLSRSVTPYLRLEHGRGDLPREVSFSSPTSRFPVGKSASSCLLRCSPRSKGRRGSIDPSESRSRERTSRIWRKRRRRSRSPFDKREVSRRQRPLGRFRTIDLQRVRREKVEREKVDRRERNGRKKVAERTVYAFSSSTSPFCSPFAYSANGGDRI